MSINSTLDARLEPLLRSCGPDAPWLRKLFASKSAYDTYSALDVELFVRNRHQSGPLLITSAIRGEGRTTVSLVLSVLTCALDPARRVLLIDADVERGRLGKMLGLPADASGLAELFTGAASVEQCMHVTALPNLCVTPVQASGEGAIQMSPLVLKELIDAAAERFDLIIIDTPPGGSNRAVLAMASMIKKAFLVVKYGSATREQVSFLIDNLRRSGAEVMGCILNRRTKVVPRMFYGQE